MKSENERSEDMERQLQQMIDTAKLFSEVKLAGEINLELPKSTCFYIRKNFSESRMAKNVEIKNLKLFVYINNPVNNRQVVGLYNTAYGLKFNMFL